MKKVISLKMWLSVFFGGIWQFIRNIFSWKNKTPFWRVVWSIITVCVVAFTSMLGYAFYDEFVRRGNNRENWREEYDTQLSNNLKYRNNGHNNGSSYIYDARTRNKLMTDIDWIAVPENGDSLIVVAKDGKRGFVNRFTARTAIPFKYDAAWIFTDGVAGVCEEDSVFFIDHSGKPINNRKFPRALAYDNYTYHGNYAAIPVKGKFGLIDRTGEWALLPEYDDIEIGPKDMWSVKYNDKFGAIGPNGQFVIPLEYSRLWIHSDNGITVAKDDNSQSRYDYNGNLIDKFVFDEIYHIAYYTKELDKDGNQKQAVDDMLKYSANNFFGLITRDGEPVTPPLYSSIDVLAPGIYECEIPSTGDRILVNSKGEKINN